MSGQTRLSQEELTHTRGFLRQLMPAEKLERMQPSGAATIYTTAVMVWMMLLQRLGGRLSLASVVRNLTSNDTNDTGVLPEDQRTRGDRLSLPTSAFSRGRLSFELETLVAIANEISRVLVSTTEPSLNGRRVYLLDGTTLKLAPTPQPKRRVPPAASQHGDAESPTLHVLVAHELQSGCAMLPQMGVMDGSKSVFESSLPGQLAKELPENSLVLGDSNFGLFSVAWCMHEQGHDFLLGLTKQRFQALTKRAVLVEECDGHLTYQLTWAPGKTDRAIHPELAEDAGLKVLIHQVPMEDNVLYMVTGLAVTAQVAGDWYSRRSIVDNDIRDIKITLDIRKIQSIDEDTIRKQLLMSVIACNLVTQFRRQAAKRANLPPRRLSFTGVWDTLTCFLLHQSDCDAEEWERRFERALKIAATQKLPNRSGRS